MRAWSALLALTLLATAAVAQVGEVPRWSTYSDPATGLTVDYPAHWYVTNPPRPDGMVGGLLTFSNRPVDTAAEEGAGEPFLSVQIGTYLVANRTELSLAEWADRYDAAYGLAAPEEVEHFSQGLTEDGRFERRGRSPLGPFAYTMVPWGETVWFVWTAGPVSGQHAAIYERIAASLSFDPERTPRALAGRYGSSFEPAPLDGFAATPVEPSPDDVQGGAPGPEISFSWKSPIRGIYTIHANSGAHADGALRAVDITCPTATVVYASAPGTEYWVNGGWDNYGYGWYVKTSDHSDKKTDCALYAHLWFEIVEPSGGTFTQSRFLAYSGASGNANGAHLHYHVMTPKSSSNSCAAAQASHNPISLVGMNGLNLDSTKYLNREAFAGTTYFANDRYRLRNAQYPSGYADVQWGGLGNATSVWLWEWNGSGAQLWNLAYNVGANTYTIRGQDSGKCLASNYPPPGDGISNVFIWTCDGSATQAWRAEPTGTNGIYYLKVQSQGFNSCLDTCCGTGTDSNVYYYPCHTSNQRWWIEPY
jgi:murein DD-endopeptidase MepM/ murein hydrolase activator NlpD